MPKAEAPRKPEFTGSKDSDKDFPPLGGPNKSKNPPGTRKSATELTSREMDEIIGDAIMDAILEGDQMQKGDLDAEYRWTVGAPSTGADHYKVTNNAELKRVPVGGKFLATRRQMIQWNKAWARLYSGENSASDDSDVEDTQVFH